LAVPAAVLSLLYLAYLYLFIRYAYKGNPALSYIPFLQKCTTLLPGDTPASIQPIGNKMYGRERPAMDLD